MEGGRPSRGRRVCFEVARENLCRSAPKGIRVEKVGLFKDGKGFRCDSVGCKFLAFLHYKDTSLKSEEARERTYHGCEDCVQIDYGAEVKGVPGWETLQEVQAGDDGFRMTYRESLSNEKRVSEFSVAQRHYSANMASHDNLNLEMTRRFSSKTSFAGLDLRSDTLRVEQSDLLVNGKHEWECCDIIFKEGKDPLIKVSMRNIYPCELQEKRC